VKRDATQLDVAIVGAGMAGSLLARQLRRRLPQLDVALFDAGHGGEHKVGEALVEISANYLLRRHQLSTYLYEKQLPKNGLRYYFDTPERDSPLEDMSEMGTVNLPFHPAFQLDRSSLELDLLDMNRAEGVRVNTDTRVHDVALGSDGAQHFFTASNDAGARDYAARWLVDAGGRAGLLARQLGLRREEAEHRIGSSWARFEGVVDIDSLDAPEFHHRVRHTARRLATIHFWYPGYWFWFIPLRGGLTSVGVSGEVVAQRKELRTPEGFRAFLDEHRAIRDLLVEAKLVDHGSYARISYSTEKFFSPDRWALIGEAASSADPLYSPGGDFIALENDYLCELVAKDATDTPSEEAAAAQSERFELFDAFMHFRHETAMRLYRGLYGGSGSFELARLKWVFDIGCYYNLWVSSYMLDEHLEPEYLKEQMRLRSFVLEAMGSFARLFQQVERELEERGDYYRRNQGEFYYGLKDLPFAEQVGEPRERGEVLDTLVEIFNFVRREALVLLGRVEKADEVADMPLTGFLTGKDLDLSSE